MRIHLQQLEVVTRKTIERVGFTAVTFLHGPVGSGKSTVARLIDFCFGGSLVATPAIQSEFVACRLFVRIGEHDVVLERDASSAAVRVTWQAAVASSDDSRAAPTESLLAPLDAERGMPLLPDFPQVENLSDLIFHLAGIEPIRVRRSKRDPDAKLVRLSFRDLLFYCYLDQDGFDSSFFAFEHPFKKYKSIDAMRFVVGFHSERLNDLEQRYAHALDEQRTKRATAEQLGQVMRELNFESELQIVTQLRSIEQTTNALREELAAIETKRKGESHPLDALRDRLRDLNRRLTEDERSLGDLRDRLAKRESLKAEITTAKMKALRADATRRVLGQVTFQRCPQCETALDPHRHPAVDRCSLCGQVPASQDAYETLATEFDERIDELEDLIVRHRREVSGQERRVAALKTEKAALDAQLDEEAKRYDAAFVARLRELERALAEQEERAKHLQHLRRIPARLEALVREGGALQSEVDAARKGIEQELERLKSAQTVLSDLAERFKELLVRVGFPGMQATHNVLIDTQSWEPRIHSGSLAWGFEDLGSGGKKVLFKGLYALAIHELAADRGLPLPTFLIVDSATKNISHDVNPELFEAFFREVYRVARGHGASWQFLLIDSELIMPADDLGDAFSERLLDHTEEAPPLISYYRGP